MRARRRSTAYAVAISLVLSSAETGAQTRGIDITIGPLVTTSPTATPTPTAAPPTATSTAVPTSTRGAVVAAPACVGDCDDSAAVTVDELIAGVDIGLGRRPLDGCSVFDDSGDGMVTVDEILRAVNSALNGCPAPDVVLQVSPGAVLLGQDRNTETLSVHAFDRNGEDVSLDDVPIEWMSSDDGTVSIAPDTVDNTSASVTVARPLGTAMVTARLARYPTVVSPLVAVTRAKLHPDAGLVPDEDVVFPPPDLPAGVSLSPDRIPDFTPADPGGEAEFGGFSESDLAALYDVTDDFVVSYPLVLRGPAPAIGQRLLASGGAPIAGFVVSTEERDGFTLVQLEVAPPQELFEDLDFSVSAEQLLEDGMLMPFDTSGWEADGGDGGSAAAGFEVGPFLCKPPVGVGVRPQFIQTPKGSNTYFGPIWDGNLRIGLFRINFFFFKAGFRAKALFHPEIRLSKGLTAELTCDLRDEYRTKQTIPVSGPLAVVLAPYFEGLVSIPFKASLNGGNTSRYGMKLGFDYALWTGGTYTSDEGWNPLCETWSECSRTDQEAQLIWDEDTSGDQVTIAGEAALFPAVDVGVQAGGIIFDVLGRIPGLGTILSGAAKSLEERGKVPVLRARLGPKGITRWNNASRTAFIEASEGAANVFVQGDVAVRLDSLNTYLATILKVVGVRSIPILTFDLFHFGEPYRVLGEDTLTVNGQRIEKGPFVPPVEVEVGDTVTVVSTVARSFINLTPIELFLTSFTYHQDFPHSGEIWVDGKSIGEMTPANDLTLTGSFQATQSLCDQADAGGGSIKVKLLAFNRMFRVVPESNFVGSFQLACKQEPLTGFIFALVEVHELTITSCSINPNQDVTVTEQWDRRRGVFEAGDPISEISRENLLRFGTNNQAVQGAGWMRAEGRVCPVFTSVLDVTITQTGGLTLAEANELLRNAPTTETTTRTVRGCEILNSC